MCSKQFHIKKVILLCLNFSENIKLSAIIQCHWWDLLLKYQMTGILPLGGAIKILFGSTIECEPCYASCCRRRRAANTPGTPLSLSWNIKLGRLQISNPWRKPRCRMCLKLRNIFLISEASKHWCTMSSVPTHQMIRILKQFTFSKHPRCGVNVEMYRRVCRRELLK